jgi:hypothetical protein
MERSTRRAIRRETYAEMSRRLASVTVVEDWNSDGGVRRTTKLDDTVPGEADLLMKMLSLAPPDAGREDVVKGKMAPAEEQAKPADGVVAEQAPAMQEDDQEDIKGRVSEGAKRRPFDRKADFDTSFDTDEKKEILDKVKEMQAQGKTDDEIYSAFNDEEFMGDGWQRSTIEQALSQSRAASKRTAQYLSPGDKVMFANGDGSSVFEVKDSQGEWTKVTPGAYGQPDMIVETNRLVKSGSKRIAFVFGRKASEDFEVGDPVAHVDGSVNGVVTAVGADSIQVKYSENGFSYSQTSSKSSWRKSGSKRIAFVLPKREECEFSVSDPEEIEADDDEKIYTMQMLEEEGHIYERLNEGCHKFIHGADPLDNNYNEKALEQDIDDILDYADFPTIAGSKVGSAALAAIVAQGNVPVSADTVFEAIKANMTPDAMNDVLIGSYENMAKYDSSMSNYNVTVTCKWTSPEGTEYEGESGTTCRGGDDAYQYEQMQGSEYEQIAKEAFEDLTDKIRGEIGASGQQEMTFASKRTAESISVGDEVEVLDTFDIHELVYEVGEVAEIEGESAKVEFPSHIADPEDFMGMPSTVTIPLRDLKKAASLKTAVDMFTTDDDGDPKDTIVPGQPRQCNECGGVYIPATPEGGPVEEDDYLCDECYGNKLKARGLSLDGRRTAEVEPFESGSRVKCVSIASPVGTNAISDLIGREGVVSDAFSDGGLEVTFDGEPEPVYFGSPQIQLEKV